MRKIIVSMNLTLDGFMAGPNCEPDWHFNFWNDEMADHMSRQLYDADTILLGRITCAAMARSWPTLAKNLSRRREDVAFAQTINSYPKTVFSKTISDPVWQNSTIIQGNLRKEILELKKLPGKALIIYGSGKLASTLKRLNLIDGYSLWVHPLVLGAGKLFFRNKYKQILLKLVEQVNFKNGVVGLRYVTLNTEPKLNSVSSLRKGKGEIHNWFRKSYAENLKYFYACREFHFCLFITKIVSLSSLLTSHCSPPTLPPEFSPQNLQKPLPCTLYESEEFRILYKSRKQNLHRR